MLLFEGEHDQSRGVLPRPVHGVELTSLVAAGQPGAETAREAEQHLALSGEGVLQSFARVDLPRETRLRGNIRQETAANGNCTELTFISTSFRTFMWDSMSPLEGEGAGSAE